ncbi:hypothetical protein AGMMS49982_18500 [Bacteroidia bacterium]|nr:hypothetical protein AGMMS49982_18500 [Bacteroidia bacterium]
MKKNVILIGIVALMSSCGDIYDNIKEFVDEEKVYPAGYSERYVKAYGGENSVVIDLCHPDSLFLPKAAHTVVVYSGRDTVFTPARSRVKIPGLTLAQVYRFKIYTEDEFGDRSKPVEVTGKPFTDEDKSSLVVASTISASATQGLFSPAPSPDLYTLCSISYNYTDKDGTVIQTDKLTPGSFNMYNLTPGATTLLHISYEFLPKDVIDTVIVSDVVQIWTMTTDEFYTYMNETQPFPNNTPRYLTNDPTIPLVINAADFDLGGYDKAFHRARTGNDGNMTYRQDGGDDYRGYGVIAGLNSGVLEGLGWFDVGDWYVYTIEVQNDGEYQVEYAESTYNNGCQARLTVDALNVLDIINIATTGYWGGGRVDWIAPVGTVKLTAGKHKLKWQHQNNANYDFGGLRLTYVGPL